MTLVNELFDYFFLDLRHLLFAKFLHIQSGFEIIQVLKDSGNANPATYERIMNSKILYLPKISALRKRRKVKIHL
jgi:hypothetical protein